MAAFDFPNSPSVNDQHTENGITFKWDGTVWKRVSATGAQGPTGSTGAQGATGPTGAQGQTGAQAYISDSAPSSGITNGDLWWDSDSGDFSIYYNDGSSAEWIEVGSTGPTGPTGAQGATGTTGAQGASGGTGAQGAAGSSGSAGAQGAVGATGAQGATGASGSATISNNANNRVITGGSGTNLVGEANLTFTGSILTVTNSSGASELTLVTPSANDSGVYFNDGSNAGALSYNHSDNSMRFRVNSTEKLRITSAGDIGIGIQSPRAKLDIEDGGTSQGVILRVSADDASPYALVVGNDSHNTDANNGLAMWVGGSKTHHIQARTSETASENKLEIEAYETTIQTGTSMNQNFVFDSSGRLLMQGAASGNAFSGGDDLIIGNTSGGRSGITLVSDSGNDGGLYFSKGTSSNSDHVKGQIVFQHDGDGGYFRLYTNASERLRIAANGDIALRNSTNSHQELQWFVSNNKSASIGWGNGSANWEFKHFRADAQANNPYANIDFFTGSTTSPTRALRITEDGNHIREKHSRFATRISYTSTNEAGNSKLSFRSAHVNVGGDFSDSNDRFTAPVDGDYAFWFHTNVARSGSGSYFATFYKNGSEVNGDAGGRIYDQHSGSGWNNLSGCILLNLSEGDYVEVYNGGQAVNYDGNSYGQWMGWLVG